MNTRTFRLLTLSIGALLAALGISGCDTPPVVMGPGSFSTVVIDAGHGGKDSGERTRGVSEKDLALDTAQRLEPLLRRAGFRTVMVRDSDTFVELDDRVAIADRYRNAILVSIHYNASGGGTSGVETYFWRADSYGLAARIERSLAEESGLNYHGVIRRVLRLTHNPVIPSVLCECGYLTNGGDFGEITNGDERQLIAKGIAAGIVAQHDHGDAGIGALPRVRERSASRHRSHVSSRRASSGRRHGSASGRGHRSSSTHHRTGKKSRRDS